jgi:hypothetical protein
LGDDIRDPAELDNQSGKSAAMTLAVNPRTLLTIGFPPDFVVGAVNRLIANRPGKLKAGLDVLPAGTLHRRAFAATDRAAATPPPVALPLFATGVASLGLLGWHSK